MISLKSDEINYFLLPPKSNYLNEDLISKHFIITRTYDNLAYVIKSNLDIDDVVNLLNDNPLIRFDIYKVIEFSNDEILL